MANVNITGLPVDISVDGSEWIPSQRLGATAERISVGMLIQAGQSGSVQNPNTVFAGPASGAADTPSFRALVAADIANIPFQPGNVYMTPLATNTYAGSDAWSVVGPFGETVDTTGTTTRGLQEAIDYAITNLVSLYVYGNDDIAVIECTTGVNATLPTQGAQIWICNTTINFADGYLGNGLTIGSMVLADFRLIGSQVVYAGNGYAVALAPDISDGGEGFIADSIIHLHTISCRGAAPIACLAIDASNGGIAGTRISGCEFNGAGQSTAYGGYGIFVPNPGTGFVVSGLTVDVDDIHNSLLSGVQVGFSATAAAQRIRGNKWNIGRIEPNVNASDGFNSFGIEEIVTIGAITNAQGGLGIGVKLQSTATNTTVTVGRINGASITSWQNLGTGNTIITGGVITAPSVIATSVAIGTTTNNVFDSTAAARPLLVQASDSSTTVGGSTAAIVISNGGTTTNNTAQLNFAAITGASANQYSSAIIATIFGPRTNAQYPTGTLVFLTSTALNQAPTQKLSIAPSGALTIGVAGTVLGTLGLSGNASGVVTIQPQAAAGTFNFNLPITAGTSGYVLTSGGGGASPMTWTNPTSLGIDLDIGSTQITNGADTRILYQTGTTLGEYTITGSGTVVAMQTSPSLITPALGIATATSIAIGGATIGSNALAVTGGVAGSAQIWSGAVSSALSTLTGGSDGFRTSAANVTQYAGENTTASSATQGGFVGVYSNDGAALASGDRLGGIRAGGSSSASALRNAALIGAFADQNWVDTSAYGSRWEFQTTNNNATSATTKLILSNGGVLSFGATAVNTVPALKPSSTTLQVRLGDDSGFAPVSSSTHILNGSSSGSVILAVPAAAGSNTITLPAGTTDFSATGGTSQVVKQTSAGGAFTVAQLAASDLSNGTTGTGTVALSGSGGTPPTFQGGVTFVNPSGNLTIIYNGVGGVAGFLLQKSSVDKWQFGNGVGDGSDNLNIYSSTNSRIVATVNGTTDLATFNYGVTVANGLITDTLRINQAPTAVGTGAKTISNAADSSTNLGHYISFNANGTTYYIPCGSVALT